MSINAIVTGSNQKSNRYPQMNVEPEEVIHALDRLRAHGAVAEVQGGGRVPRYRHFAYEWLGVNKVELAVMAELLLRGTQTEGELRGRAARMEPIADVAALRPVLDALKAKRLVVSLTPTGRGHTVTHNLYEPQEMEKQHSLHAGHGGDDEPPPRSSAEGASAERSASRPTDLIGGLEGAPIGRSRAPAGSSSLGDDAYSIERELASLRSDIAQLKSELADLAATHQRTADELRSVRDAIGGE
jgi:uncharacterized protein YceH (UPF0502 family)